MASYVKNRLTEHIRQPGGGFWGWLAIRLMIPRNRRINEWAVALLDIHPADRVLEIGFGAGLSIKRVARLATDGFVAGIDYSEHMVAQASQRNRTAIRAGRVALRQGDAAALPYADSEFDKAFCVGLIYYLPDPAAALREARRVLKPGGTFVLMSRCQAALKENPVFMAGNNAIYTPDELVALLEQAGFRRAWIAPDAPDPSGVAAVGVA